MSGERFKRELFLQEMNFEGEDGKRVLSLSTIIQETIVDYMKENGGMPISLVAGALMFLLGTGLRMIEDEEEREFAKEAALQTLERTMR